jgi:hypothetical protein
MSSLISSLAMKSQPAVMEKRQSVRCPLPEQRQNGVLCIGEKRLPLQLLDVSAGGFSALCRGLQGIEVGAAGFLQADEDWFEVRVANLRPVETTPISDGDPWQIPLTHENPAQAPLPVPLSPFFRLGLHRLGDVVDPNSCPTANSWRSVFCGLTHLNPGAAGVCFLGIALAAVVAIVPYLSTRMTVSEPGAAKINNPFERRAFPQSAVEKMSANLAEAAAGDSPPQKSKLSSAAGDQLDSLRRALRHSSGATAFTLPEIVRHLQLSASQYERIEQMIESANDMIDDLWTDVDDVGELEQLCSEILEDNKKSVLGLLNDDQRKKWRELAGESLEP